MQIGMMNNPQAMIWDEVRYVLDQDFDFLDWTQEPPNGQLNKVSALDLREVFASNGKFIVGHTAYYLPIDCPFSSVRNAVKEVLSNQLEVFSAAGVDRVTLHLGFSYPHRMFTYRDKLNMWVDALEGLVVEADNYGITLMLENVTNGKESLKVLKDLIKVYPKLGFHLDVGHANLHSSANTTYLYLQRFKHQLKHVHLSDNFGRSDDLHLPLGAGGIPWQHILKLIKRTGYDGSFTLEVFSKERSYLLKSREYLRMMWESI